MEKPILADKTSLVGDDETGILEACRVYRAAFLTLYHRYLGAVYRYVYFRVESRADAEDLVSQIFLAALESLPN